MAKWRSVKVKQELMEKVENEVEKGQYQSLSEFVSDAIQLRMQKLTKERVAEYLKRDRYISVPQLHAQVFYTPKNIWAQATLQGTVRLGITDYFQHQLKEIVNIQTGKVGDEVSRDETFGVAETWWFTHDLYSPLNGKIVSVNTKVIDNPFVVNVDPYQWIVGVEPKQTEVNSWMNGLLSLGEYKQLIPREVPGVHVSLEREWGEQGWSYVRTPKREEAPHLNSSRPKNKGR